MRRARADNSKKDASTTVAPRYRTGDYVKIELRWIFGDRPMAVWIRVDHCDERRAIVFGTIDSDLPDELTDRSLRRGARLAASYTSVLQHVIGV
jgi:hypothetical protein